MKNNTGCGCVTQMVGFVVVLIVFGILAGIVDGIRRGSMTEEQKVAENIRQTEAALQRLDELPYGDGVMNESAKEQGELKELVEKYNKHFAKNADAQGYHHLKIASGHRVQGFKVTEENWQWIQAKAQALQSQDLTLQSIIEAYYYDVDLPPSSASSSVSIEAAAVQPTPTPAPTPQWTTERIAASGIFKSEAILTSTPEPTPIPTPTPEVRRAETVAPKARPIVRRAEPVKAESPSMPRQMRTIDATSLPHGLIYVYRGPNSSTPMVGEMGSHVSVTVVGRWATGTRCRWRRSGATLKAVILSSETPGPLAEPRRG